MNKEFVSVWGYLGALEKPSIEIYEQWDVFLKTLSPEQTITDDVIDQYLAVLEDNGVVSFLREGDEIPVSSEPEKYFDWFFQRLQPIHDHFPSAEAIRLTREGFDKNIFPVNVRDVELFASGYLTPLMVLSDFDIHTYIKWLFDPFTASFEQKKMTIFKQWMDFMENQVIEEQGFFVRNVFSNNPVDKWKRYSYTKGLKKEHKFEVLLVNGGAQSGNVLAAAVKLLLDKKLVLNEPGELEDFHVNEVPVRVKFVELDPASKTYTQLEEYVRPVATIYQLYIGDPSNKLPGEDGYDAEFVQTLDTEI